MMANLLLSKKLQAYHDEIWPLTVYQKNSNTRHWEYPWIIEQVEDYRKNKINKDLQIIEIGGGNSCLQYYYAKQAVEYTNVESASAYCDKAIAEKLKLNINYIFNKFENINLESKRYNILICASVLEHTEIGSEEEIIKNISKCLLPGGISVFTVDWFFDHKIGESCQWGRNINCQKIIEIGKKYDLELELGDKKFLSGYPHFDEISLKKNPFVLKVCNKGIWVTSQAFVLKKISINI